MKTEHENINVIGLIVLLITMSFFKDDITPDYLNTTNAAFLGNKTSRLLSLSNYPWFWLIAIGYSLLFAIVPYYIIKTACSKEYALYILYILCLIIVFEYSLIFSHFEKIDHYIIPKINRFFHSPIFTFFFLAAFKVNLKMKDGR